MNDHEDAELEKARQWLAGAEKVYFLGYGFDQNNNKLLGLPESSLTNCKSIYYTNYGNSSKIRP